jgi:hypothetical protein
MHVYVPLSTNELHSQNSNYLKHREQNIWSCLKRCEILWNAPNIITSRVVFHGRWFLHHGIFEILVFHFSTQEVVSRHVVHPSSPSEDILRLSNQALFGRMLEDTLTKKEVRRSLGKFPQWCGNFIKNVERRPIGMDICPKYQRGISLW